MDKTSVYGQISKRKSVSMSNELSISTRGIMMPESPIRKLAPLAYKAEDERTAMVASLWKINTLAKQFMGMYEGLYN